jgi:hypothetical protein
MQKPIKIHRDLVLPLFMHLPEMFTLPFQRLLDPDGHLVQGSPQILAAKFLPNGVPQLGPRPGFFQPNKIQLEPNKMGSELAWLCLGIPIHQISP